MFKSLISTIIFALLIAGLLGFFGGAAGNAKSTFDSSAVGSAFSNSASCAGETGLIGGTLKSINQC